MHKQTLNDKLFNIMVEEAIDRYAEDIANTKPDDNMTDEEIQIMMEQKQRIYKNVKAQIRKSSIAKRHYIRKCLVVAACFMVVFALAVNVSAFRTFVYKTYTDIKGTILNVGKTQEVNKQYGEIKNFIKKDEIIIPNWLPRGLTLSSISDDDCQLNLQYSDNSIWISLTEKFILSEETGVHIETERNSFHVTEYDVLGMQASIVKMHTESSNDVFTVTWCSDEVEYELSSNCSEIMLESILSELKYLY